MLFPWPGSACAAASTSSWRWGWRGSSLSAGLTTTGRFRPSPRGSSSTSSRPSSAPSSSTSPSSWRWRQWGSCVGATVSWSGGESETSLDPRVYCFSVWLKHILLSILLSRSHQRADTVWIHYNFFFMLSLIRTILKMLGVCDPKCHSGRRNTLTFKRLWVNFNWWFDYCQLWLWLWSNVILYFQNSSHSLRAET